MFQDSIFILKILPQTKPSFREKETIKEIESYPEPLKSTNTTPEQ